MQTVSRKKICFRTSHISQHARNKNKLFNIENVDSPAITISSKPVFVCYDTSYRGRYILVECGFEVGCAWGNGNSFRILQNTWRILTTDDMLIHRSLIRITGSPKSSIRDRDGVSFLTDLRVDWRQTLWYSGYVSMELRRKALAIPFRSCVSEKGKLLPICSSPILKLAFTSYTCWKIDNERHIPHFLAVIWSERTCSMSFFRYHRGPFLPFNLYPVLELRYYNTVAKDSFSLQTEKNNNTKQWGSFGGNLGFLKASYGGRNLISFVNSVSDVTSLLAPFIFPTNIFHFIYLQFFCTSQLNFILYPYIILTVCVITYKM